MPRRIADFCHRHSRVAAIFCGAESDELLGFMTVRTTALTTMAGGAADAPSRPGKDQNAFFSVRAAARRPCHNDWLGFVRTITRRKRIKRNIRRWLLTCFATSPQEDVKAGIWGFWRGFHDNMKIRCWYEHHFPLLMTEGLILIYVKAAQTATTPPQPATRGALKRNVVH